jgi:hypothetical protein
VAKIRHKKKKKKKKKKYKNRQNAQKNLAKIWKIPKKKKKKKKKKLSQTGDHAQKDLAEFGYRTGRNEITFKKKHPSIFSASYLNHVYKSGKIYRVFFFFKFWRFVFPNLNLQGKKFRN